MENQPKNQFAEIGAEPLEQSGFEAETSIAKEEESIKLDADSAEDAL
jgi:hypothetical protein